MSRLRFTIPASLLVAALATLAPCDDAWAEEAPQPERPTRTWSWPRFRRSEFVLTGVAGAVAVGSAVAPVASWKWSAASGFDDGVRDALRLGSYQQRRTAMDVSDVLLASSIAFPILADGLVSAWGRHRSRDVATQMILIDVETFAVAGALTSATSALVNRERPYAANGSCGTELPENHRDCDESFRFRYRSFFSGHTSLAFTGASLVCTHHMNLHLYGGAGDVAACIAAYGVAAGTGALRIAGDVHYATDVLTGAAAGTLVGLGLPYLLHYRDSQEGSQRAGGLRVFLVPTPSGASLSGTF